jgi:DNA-directed RNA polymerase specialized sigma24 family protein
MEKTQFTELLKRLDTIAKLLAMSLVKDAKTEDDKVSLLHDSGFKNVEIANILNKTSNSVDQSMHRIRKKRNSSQLEEKK